jgi:chromosome segregation ATPase
MMGGSLDGESAGIIPRLCKDLLQELYHPIIDNPSNASTTRRTQAEVEVGYFEVYNERIYDLLSSSNTHTNCRVREHPRDGIYVEGLTLKQAKSYQDVHNLLIEGHSHRQVAATLMNAESSRSHAIFMLQISQQLEMPIQTNSSADNPPFKTTTLQRKSKVSLIDLAGSERLNSTGATGDRLKEATNINRSLSVLGDVIRALSEQSSESDEKFIPYRNSILTWIMKDSLGGNSKTTMLATISPIDASYSESMNTLRYVERAKLIVSKAIVNDDNSNDPYVRHLQEQVTALKHKLHSLAQRMKQREEEYQQHVDKLKREYEVKLKKEKQKFQQQQQPQQQQQQQQQQTTGSSRNGLMTGTSPNGDDVSILEDISVAGTEIDDTASVDDQGMQSKDEINRLRSELHSKIQEMSFLYEDVDTYTSQITYLESELKNQQLECQYQYECLERYKKEMEETQEKESDASRVCERLREALAAKMEDYDESVKHREYLEEEQEELKKEIKKMSEILILEKNKVADLEKECERQQSIRDELQTIRDELSSTKRELEDRESQVSSGSLELQSVRDELQTIRDELSSTKRELEDRESQVSSGSLELQSVRDELQTIRDELSSTKRKLDSLGDESELKIDVLLSELSSSKSELEECEVELNELRLTSAETVELKDQLNHRGEQVSLLEAKVIAVEAENAALIATLDQLKQRLPSNDSDDGVLAGISALNDDIQLELSQYEDEDLPSAAPLSPQEMEKLYLTELNLMKETLQKTQTEFEKYRTQSKEIQGSFQELNLKFDQLTKEKDRYFQELNQSKEENLDLTEEIGIIRKKLKESQCELSDAVMEVKQKVLEVQRLKHQLTSSSSSTTSPNRSEYFMSSDSNTPSTNPSSVYEHDSDSIAQVWSFRIDITLFILSSLPLSLPPSLSLSLPLTLELLQDLATAKMTIAQLNNDLMDAHSELRQLKKARGGGTLMSMFKS